MPTSGLADGAETMEGFGLIIRGFRQLRCRIFGQLLRCRASLQLEQAGGMPGWSTQSRSNKRIRGISVRSGSEANTGLVSVSSRTLASTSRNS